MMKPDKIKLSRKAIMSGTLITLVIAIFSFAVISMALAKFSVGKDDYELENLCKTSIAMRAKTAFQFKGEAAGIDVVKAQLKPFPVMCATLDKKISGKRELIKKQIADKMARCWWMFGEGKYEELLHGTKAQVLPALFGFDELENKCFNCYTILIDQDELNLPITADELLRFMYETKYPKLKDVTYLQYIQSYGGSGRVVYMATEGESSKPIMARHAYTISIAPILKKTEDSATTGIVKIAGAGVGAFILGAATSGVGLVVAGGIVAGTLTMASGVNDIKASLYGEREVSSIYFDTLQDGQRNCGFGDLRGE